MIIDMDNSKTVNDTYGHFGGDMILRDLVNTALALISGKYVLGRLGGDEFVVLLPVEFEKALEFAENLRECVSEKTVKYLNDKIVYTVSIGVAGCPYNECELTDLLHKADLALYKAKRNGFGYTSYRDTIMSIDIQLKYKRLLFLADYKNL